MKYTITIDTANVAFNSPFFQDSIRKVLRNAAQIITEPDFELKFRGEWILRDLNDVPVGKVICTE